MQVHVRTRIRGPMPEDLQFLVELDPNPRHQTVPNHKSTSLLIRLSTLNNPLVPYDFILGTVKLNWICTLKAAPPILIVGVAAKLIAKATKPATIQPALSKV